METVKPNQRVYFDIPVANPTTQAGTNADTTPTAAVYKNGTLDAGITTTVNGTPINNSYEGYFDVPSNAVAGDSFKVKSQATVIVNSTPITSPAVTIWRGLVDTARASEVLSDTANIKTRIPASLASGRMIARTEEIADNAISAASVAAAAVTKIQNGLSTFNVATQGVTVTTNNDKTGYALSNLANDVLAVAVESHLLDEGDSQPLINALVTAIGNANVDELALVAAIRSDMERVGGFLQLLIIRATEARLAKLDVSGDLAHTNNANAFKATGFATQTSIDQAETGIIGAIESLNNLSIGDLDALRDSLRGAGWTDESLVGLQTLVAAIHNDYARRVNDYATTADVNTARDNIKDYITARTLASLAYATQVKQDASDLVINAIATVSARLNTMLVAAGEVFRFTADSHAGIPAGEATISEDDKIEIAERTRQEIDENSQRLENIENALTQDQAIGSSSPTGSGENIEVFAGDTLIKTIRNLGDIADCELFLTIYKPTNNGPQKWTEIGESGAVLVNGAGISDTTCSITKNVSEGTAVIKMDETITILMERGYFLGRFRKKKNDDITPLSRFDVKIR